jgi:hypothetical protein
MYPHTDAQTMLQLHNERTDALRREAAAYRVARSASPAARHRRFGRASRRAQGVSAPAMP